MDHSLCSAFTDNDLVYNHRHYEQLTVDHIPPQTHDIYEMIYIKNGDITYSVEEKSYRIKSNSLILTRPGDLHILQINDRTLYDRYDIFFEADAVQSGVFSQISEEFDVVEFGEDLSISLLFQKMDLYCRHFDGAQLKSVLMDLVEQIVYELVIFIRQGAADQASRYTVNPTVAAAIEYIDSHLHTNLCLDTLCRELYISKSYLHQLFMRHLQISPRRYIAGKRLLGAQQAIRAGARPMDIYTKFGFSEYSSFYRAYRKQFGHAPSEELDRRVIREIEF